MSKKMNQARIITEDGKNFEEYIKNEINITPDELEKKKKDLEKLAKKSGKSGPISEELFMAEIKRIRSAEEEREIRDE